MREDHFTHTEADAGAYERYRAMDDDDRPSRSDLEADEHPTPEATRFMCLHCFATFVAWDVRNKHQETCTGEYP